MVGYATCCLSINNFHQDSKDKEFIHHTAQDKMCTTWKDTFQWKQIKISTTDDLTVAPVQGLTPLCQALAAVMCFKVKEIREIKLRAVKVQFLRDTEG